MTKNISSRILIMGLFDVCSHEVPSSFIQTLINKKTHELEILCELEGSFLFKLNRTLVNQYLYTPA